MSNFGILIKSHAPDLGYAERLVDSINRHNVDAIPCFLVVPDRQIPLFEHLAGPHVTLMGEEQFGHHLVRQEVAGLTPGYLNQEIIKLCFWEAGLTDNYLCMDSDAEFIRDFTLADFMADEHTPYTFLSEDAELRVEPEYYRVHWQGREGALRRIQQEVGLDDPRLLTTHGHSVFSARVLRAFKERFLDLRDWDYVDALAIAPFEPSWYNFWLQKDETIPIVMREPIIKVFHNATQQLDYVLRGVSTDDVARGYIAIVVNSNYSRSEGITSLTDAPEYALASFVTARELVQAIGYRTRLHLVEEMRLVRRVRTVVGAAVARLPWFHRYVDLGD